MKLSHAILELFMTFIIWFTKGEWLEAAVYYAMQTYKIAKLLSYLASAAILVGLATLAIGTMTHLFLDAIGVASLTFQTLHNITETVVNNKTAWAAFAILVANITFMFRSQTVDIQQETLRLQKLKWHYEREKIKDEHNAYEAKKQAQFRSVTNGLGDLTTSGSLNR